MLTRQRTIELLGKSIDVGIIIGTARGRGY
jgi:hypothetical protein